LEIEQSCRIVLQALDSMPAGEFLKRPKVVKPKPGEVYARAEAPRGEIGFYVIADGTDKPFRVKAKSPSFCALSGFHEYTRDLLVADVIATLGSIDIVLGEVDR
jgi:NADH-quinone oxidoreductase subunit D